MSPGAKVPPPRSCWFVYLSLRLLPPPRPPVPSERPIERRFKAHPPCHLREDRVTQPGSDLAAATLGANNAHLIGGLRLLPESPRYESCQSWKKLWDAILTRMGDTEAWSEPQLSRASRPPAQWEGPGGEIRASDVSPERTHMGSASSVSPGVGEEQELQHHQGRGPRARHRCSRYSYHGLPRFHSRSRKAGSTCQSPHFTDEEKRGTRRLMPGTWHLVVPRILPRRGFGSVLTKRGPALPKATQLELHVPGPQTVGPRQREVQGVGVPLRVQVGEGLGRDIPARPQPWPPRVVRVTKAEGQRPTGGSAPTTSPGLPVVLLP